MRRLTILLAAIAVLALPANGSAHPLGNFTVNRYAGIEIAGDRIYVHYVLDLAEIPTLQLGTEVRSAEYPSRLADALELTLDGRRVPLRVVERRSVVQRGAGGLETLRLDVVFGGKAEGSELRFRDGTFAERVGWREVALSARDGARVLRASVPAVSASRELRAYPEDELASPADVTSATAEIAPGVSPGPPPVLGAFDPPQREASGFEALVERGDLSAGATLLALLVAAFWGAAHALTPGHGKALVAAYLVGTRGTPRQAFILGGTVTIAHTAGVFAIGLVTLALSQLIVPEELYPWLTLVSGLLVVGVGASVLRQRARRPRHCHDDRDAHHEHVTSKGILGVGVAAGLLPCPSALVVLLSAIALHRVGLGLALIVAFSLGLAATITGIGLVAVFARRALGRLVLEGRVVRALPAASAALILGVGLVITAKALPGVL